MQQKFNIFKIDSFQLLRAFQCKWLFWTKYSYIGNNILFYCTIFLLSLITSICSFLLLFFLFFLGFYWQFIPDIFFNRLLSILLKHLVIVKYRAIKYCRCQDKEVKYSQVHNGQQFCQKVGNKIIGSN